MSDNASTSRRSKGRRKVEMVKIPKESNLQVTFSKRRAGLFKKASELCTLCGAEVAIIVFSPGNKVFSFGHPCVEAVVDRFLTGNPPQMSGTMQLLEAHWNANARELNMHLTQVLRELDAEKNRGEELNQIRKASQAQCWWEAPVEELDMPHLEQLNMSLEELKKNVRNQANNNMRIQSSNLPHFFGGSSLGAGGINVPFDQSSNPLQFFPGSSSGGGAVNLPFDQSSNPPQFFAGSGSGGGEVNLPFDQSSNPPQFFAGSSSGGGGSNLPFDAQDGTAAGFNANMMPHNPGFGHGLN